jgi:hypothetical protein
VNQVGGFLCELAVVERGQPEPLCRRIDVLPGAARVHLADRVCEVPLEADRWAITEALHQQMDVVDPGLRRSPVADHPDRHDLWAELLHDLGWYYPDMASISRVRAPDQRPWGYHRIERSGPQAWVVVTDGRHQLTRTIDLDAGQLPVAIPIEIADSIPLPANRATSWRSPLPPTGLAGTWIRRLLGRP